MSNEYENLAKMILSTPQGSKIANSIDKLNNVVSTKEGAELLTMLAQGGSTDAIRQAAQAAATGDADRAKTMMSSLLSTPEGAALAAKIAEMMK